VSVQPEGYSHEVVRRTVIACGVVIGECTYGSSVLSLAEMSLSSTCNILLNNYCKRAADKRRSGKHKGKRKLSTLTK